ncbi:MAG TPA: hypothetical protein VKB51_07795 [bacterium]|nr:hypothetical protein [bacterium]
MDVPGHVVQRHIDKPTHALPRKYIEPIMYLAERMSQQDKIVPAPGKRTVDQLAEALQLKDFRRQPWFRSFNEKRACEMIDLETVKRGALVIISLVMKADTTRGEAAKAYFHKVREMLETEPIAVPTELDAHRDLAMRYLVG